MSTYFVGVNDVPGAEDVHAAFEHHSRMKSAEIQQQAGRLNNAKERRRQEEGYYDRKDSAELKGIELGNDKTAIAIEGLQKSNEKLQIELEDLKRKDAIMDEIRTRNPNLMRDSATAELMGHLAASTAKLRGYKTEDAYLAMTDYGNKAAAGIATEDDLRRMVQVLNARSKDDVDLNVNDLLKLPPEMLQKLFDANYATIQADYNVMQQIKLAEAKASPGASTLHSLAENGAVLPNAYAMKQDTNMYYTFDGGKTFSTHLPEDRSIIVGKELALEGSPDLGTGDSTGALLAQATKIRVGIAQIQQIIGQGVQPQDIRRAIPEKVSGAIEVLQDVMPDKAQAVVNILKRAQEGLTDDQLRGAVLQKTQMALLTLQVSNILAGQKGGAQTSTEKVIRNFLQTDDLIDNTAFMPARMEALNNYLHLYLNELKVEYMGKHPDGKNADTSMFNLQGSLAPPTGKPTAADTRNYEDFKRLADAYEADPSEANYQLLKRMDGQRIRDKDGRTAVIKIPERVQ